MKVLAHFRGSILDSRGTPLRSRNLVHWLSRRPGVEVTLLSRDPSAEVVRLIDVDHIEVPSAEEGLAVLRAAVARRRPDVVYGQTHKGALDLAGLAAAERPWLVVDLHGDLACEKLEDRQRPLHRRLSGFLSARWGELRSLPRLDGFTAVSEALLERVARYGKPARLLLGGVDPELFRAAPLIPSERITVGYAGSFRSYHGIDDLVAAAARLVARREPFRFLLLGDLAQAPRLRARIERQLGDRATLLEPVPHDRVPEILGRCDVLVVPRRRGRAAASNYPSKLSEYLALGRAVVLTDVGQAGRLAASGDIALKVPPGDPAALERALLSLKDPESRSRLGSAARRFAVQKLAWTRIAASLEGFLREVAAGAGRPTG